jgi:hypothetical protein
MGGRAGLEFWKRTSERTEKAYEKEWIGIKKRVVEYSEMSKEYSTTQSPCYGSWEAMKCKYIAQLCVPHIPH